MELTHRNLFEDDDHRARFRDLMDCYASYPFFSKGLCKCMYLGAWDQEHFIELLGILNEILIERDYDLALMRDNGAFLAESAKEAGDMASCEMMKLSTSFLSDHPYDKAGLGYVEVSDPEIAYRIKRALQVSQCIDDLPPFSPDPAEFTYL